VMLDFVYKFWGPLWNGYGGLLSVGGQCLHPPPNSCETAWFPCTLARTPHSTLSSHVRFWLGRGDVTQSGYLCHVFVCMRHLPRPPDAPGSPIRIRSTIGQPCACPDSGLLEFQFQCSGGQRCEDLRSPPARKETHQTPHVAQASKPCISSYAPLTRNDA
jgi:hypothetical protein